MKRLLTLALASTILSGLVVNNAQARCLRGSCGVRLAIIKKAPKRAVLRVRNFPPRRRIACRSCGIGLVRGMAVKRVLVKKVPAKIVRVKICKNGSCFRR